MSDPCVSCVVGNDPARSNSTKTSPISPPIKSLAIRPILNAAAQCELDGPRITGPITSLKILTIINAHTDPDPRHGKTYPLPTKP